MVATDVDRLTPRCQLGSPAAANGTVVVNADGTFTYTPKPTSTAPTASPTRVTDGDRRADTATVTLTVNPVNDAPVAQFGDGAVDEDTTLIGALVDQPTSTARP